MAPRIHAGGRREPITFSGMDADPQHPVCPYLDRDDARCAGRWTLTHLDQAFAFCLGEHLRCAMFHRLRAEQAVSPRRPLRLVADHEETRSRVNPFRMIDVTCHGRRLARLGATGS